MRSTFLSLLTAAALGLTGCSSVSTINDDLHSGVGGLIAKGSHVTGRMEQRLGHTLQRWEYDSQVYLTALRDDADLVIEQWLQDGQYGLALATLDAVRTSHPKYAALQQRRPAIAAQAAAYEDRVVTLARQDMDKQQWDQALQRLDEALAVLPDSQPLQQGREAVHQRQAEHGAELQRQLDFSEGKRLLESLDLQRHALAVKPRDELARLTLEKNQRKARHLALTLQAYGNQAIQQQRYETARRYLGLALELDPDLQADEAFEDIQLHKAELLLQQGRQYMSEGRYKQARRAFEQARKRQDTEAVGKALAELNRREQQKHQTEAADLVQRYDGAMAADSLAEAKSLLEQIIRIEGNTEANAGRQAELEQKIRLAINYHMEQASRHYGRDHFEKAIAHWNQVLALDPMNEQARQKAERARRIVDKLDQLRQKQNP